MTIHTAAVIGRDTAAAAVLISFAVYAAMALLVAGMLGERVLRWWQGRRWHRRLNPRRSRTQAQILARAYPRPETLLAERLIARHRGTENLIAALDRRPPPYPVPVYDDLPTIDMPVTEPWPR